MGVSSDAHPWFLSYDSPNHRLDSETLLLDQVPQKDHRHSNHGLAIAPQEFGDLDMKYQVPGLGLTIALGYIPDGCPFSAQGAPVVIQWIGV